MYIFLIGNKNFTSFFLCLLHKFEVYKILINAQKETCTGSSQNSYQSKTFNHFFLLYHNKLFAKLWAHFTPHSHLTTSCRDFRFGHTMALGTETSDGNIKFFALWASLVVFLNLPDTQVHVESHWDVLYNKSDLHLD